MNRKKEKGSIAIFVLVALLFMVGFLILAFASNVNKSKALQEQFDAVRQIYAYSGEEQGAYDKAYTDLRRKNKQLMTASVENNSILELNKTYAEKISNYRIYGNSVQNGTPTPDNPVEIQSVGDKTPNLFNTNVTPESIKVYLGINMSNINKDYTLQIKLKEGKTIPENVYFGFVYYKDEMSTSASADWLLTSENGLNTKLGNGTTYALTTFNPSVYYQDGICCYPASQENWDSIMDAFEINLVEGSYHSENIPEYTPYGKYRIPIKLTNENGESTTTNIYLDEPLRKVEDSADYIDFKTKKVVRTDGTEQNINLPELATFEDYTKIEILTEIKPSKVEVEYIGYTLE